MSLNLRVIGPCGVVGCGRVIRARGVCSGHYSRLKANGSVGSVSIAARNKNKGRTCMVQDCEREPVGSGCCDKHYQRLMKWGDPNVVKVPKRPHPVECGVKGCARRAEVRGMCGTHYQRWRTKSENGLDRPIRRHRPNGAGGNDGRGYVVLSLKGRRVAQHRHVMERLLGRALLPEENVHHKNGDRSDNRSANLELWSTRQPQGQRVEDKIEWAKQLLALYEPAALSCAPQKERSA